MSTSVSVEEHVCMHDIPANNNSSTRTHLLSNEKYTKKGILVQKKSSAKRFPGAGRTFYAVQVCTRSYKRSFFPFFPFFISLRLKKNLY